MKLFELLESKKLYHGSTEKIDKFNGIVYFTPRKDAAAAYGRGKNKHSFYVYEVDLKLKNPIQFKTMQQIGSLDIKTIQQLKLDGYDGAFYDGSGKEPIPEYVSFYPERIKILNCEANEISL